MILCCKALYVHILHGPQRREESKYVRESACVVFGFACPVNLIPSRSEICQCVLSHEYALGHQFCGRPQVTVLCNVGFIFTERKGFRFVYFELVLLMICIILHESHPDQMLRYQICEICPILKFESTCTLQHCGTYFHTHLGLLLYEGMYCPYCCLCIIRLTKSNRKSHLRLVLTYKLNQATLLHNKSSLDIRSMLVMHMDVHACAKHFEVMRRMHHSSQAFMKRAYRVVI
mmetsp:Transcript_43509/g.83041  ORF Transcript_43509/g.83041 Transcript_43509/m.83041 type:complete len:231 (-) Transcript_43509:835-1527(-)